MEKVREAGLVAVVRGESRRAAVGVSDALVEGGVACVEVAFTTPDAHLAIADLASDHGDGVLVGAGTVTTREQAELAAQAGASFLVSPGCDPGLLHAMLGLGLLVLPGVLTPSEVLLARRLGVQALKLFPGSLGGPSYLKALLGPFPGVPFVPTGGVSPENAAEWFAAGAIAVGAGGALAPPTLEGRDRAGVVEAARAFAAAVREARSETKATRSGRGAYR